MAWVIINLGFINSRRHMFHSKTLIFLTHSGICIYTLHVPRVECRRTALPYPHIKSYRKKFTKDINEQMKE